MDGFIGRSSFDEFPQFFSVLAGVMSAIGDNTEPDSSRGTQKRLPAIGRCTDFPGKRNAGENPAKKPTYKRHLTQLKQRAIPASSANGR